MLVTFGYYPGDIQIVLPLLEWMEELGGCHGHTLLLCHDARCPQLDVAAILARAKGIFDDVRDIPAQAAIDGWPEGGNYMFHVAATYLGNVRGLKHWLWIEPDAIPLKENWLDDLGRAYEEAGKPFMGDDVNVGNVPRHMSGVGVYPNPLVEFAGEAMRCHDLAWDMASKDQILPQAHFTELIEHAWRHPTFKNQHEVITQINPKTILFHSSKDGTLIKLLHEKLQSERQSAKTPDLLEKQRSVAHAAPTDSLQESLPEDLRLINGEPISPPLPDLGQMPPNWEHMENVAIKDGILVVQDSTKPWSISNKPREPISPPLDTFPVPVLAEPKSSSPENGRGLVGEARESASKVTDGIASDSRGGETICDIFIRTYPGDYNWLAYCLKSIHKYATGFRKIWIVSPATTPFEPFFDPNFIEWKVLNEEAEDGYLSQQIHKLYADAVTGYEADFYLHIDSDTLFTRPVTPQDFFQKEITPQVSNFNVCVDRLVWYFTPYEHTETPWQPITEKFMGHGVPHEFMRRLPMMVPKWLYAKLREYCFLQHKRIISEYIRAQPYREFSEFNALGAFAWQYHHDKFHWVNTLETEMPQPFARQFFSWDGITDDVKKEIQEILSGEGGQPDGNRVAQPEPAATPPTQNFEPKNLISKTPPSFPNGEWSSGDCVRWLSDYIKQKPNRRQYVLKQLAKARLLPLRKGRPVKNM